MAQFCAITSDAAKFPLREEKAILEAAGIEVIPAQFENDDQAIAEAGPADAILSLVYPLTRKLLSSLPKCKLITRYGIGLDAVDLQAATDLGILVANVPDFCLDEVADTAMSLILATWRKLLSVASTTKQGLWDLPRAMPIHRIKGSTLGLVGFGNIARRVARRAHPFGFRIVTYDPYVCPQDATELPVESVSLERLLTESDAVSIHVPLTDETRHLFGPAELARMKPTAFLVNTSRGGVVDPAALHQVLKEGQLAGAGLDVLETEPPDPDDPLLALDNVIVTPHYASYTEEAYHELRVKVAESVIAVRDGRAPKYFVNPEVRGHARVRGSLSQSSS